jgi:hypothetical protein
MIFNLITSAVLLFLAYKTAKFLFRQFSLLVLGLALFWIVILLGLWIWHPILGIEQSEYAISALVLAVTYIVYLMMNKKFHYMEMTITSLVRTIATINSRRNN